MCVWCVCVSVCEWCVCMCVIVALISDSVSRGSVPLAVVVYSDNHDSLNSNSLFKRITRLLFVSQERKVFL